MFSLFKQTPDSATTAAADASSLPSVAPDVDVVDMGREIVLYAELPGVSAAALDLAVEGDRLTIRGKPNTPQPKGLTLVHGESVRRTFERTYALSDTIDRERISARITNGVAVITLPRRDAVSPRKIQVQVG